MKKQDMVFLVISLSSMALGVFMPFLAAPMEWVPKVTMLSLLFMSFLSIDCRDVWRNLLHFPGSIVFFMLVKLLFLPVLCWCTFRIVMPEFALAAAVLGGAPVAVAAPFYALMVQADFVIVLAGLVCSSLLLPLTLPAVLVALQTFVPLSGGVDGAAMQLPVLSMMLNLGVTMTVPFIAAQVIRRLAASLTARVLRFRTIIFIGCLSAGNLAIFSKYSGIIRNTPQYVLFAIIGACVACLLLFLFATAVTLWMPPEKQLAVTVGCVAMNNVLMLIMSVEFFSVTEALLAAMYSGPFFLSVLLYRLLARLRGVSAPNP